MSNTFLLVHNSITLSTYFSLVHYLVTTFSPVSIFFSYLLYMIKVSSLTVFGENRGWDWDRAWQKYSFKMIKTFHLTWSMNKTSIQTYISTISWFSNIRFININTLLQYSLCMLDILKLYVVFHVAFPRMWKGPARRQPFPSAT